MARPRIILADTDVQYLLSIQLKFVEEFFEKIDLEIITDQEYFENLFMLPQRADVLVVSENLYTVSLQKHNISHVFMMTEQQEEEGTQDLKVTKIYKYTSIKEIFNIIAGKAANDLNVEETGKKGSQIVVVTSAAGGVGKTTVAMGLAAALSKNYKKVLYLNTERIQSFQYLLKNESPIGNNDIYMKLIQNDMTVYEDIKHVIRTELFSYFPPLKAATMSLGIERNVFRNLAVQARKSQDYDFIIIDTDSAFDELKTELLELADKVVLVLKQTKNAIYSTKELIKNINGTGTEKYSIVCNDYAPQCSGALHEYDELMQLQIGEYIEHTEDFEAMMAAEYLNIPGFSKIAYMLL